MLHKTIFIALFLFSAFGPTSAATYHFSSTNGDDSRSSVQAQSPLTPWKTLAKLNTQMPLLQPGDSVLFKCGDTLYGTVALTRSGSAGTPLVFSSYGSGNKPVITGMAPLTSWTSASSNTWEADCPECDTVANVLLLGGKSRPLGRFPNATAANKGYLNFESFTSTSITDNELPGSPDWTGAELVMRPLHYIITRRKVLSHTGTTLTFNGTMPAYASNGFGYFFQNDPRTLDQYGEWCYTAATKKVRVYTDANSPASLQVRVAVQPVLFNLSSRSYVTVENLAFIGANDMLLNVAGTQNAVVRNCDLRFAALAAVYGDNTAALRLENNSVTESNNFAFDLYGRNIVVSGNAIRNTGVNPGMGRKTGGAQFYGMSVIGNSNLIEFNTIDSTGYLAISFQGDSVTVRNNVINTFCFVLQDGGAIYTYNACPDNPSGLYGVRHTGQKILGNIILHGVGANEGTPNSDYSAANGIYLDDASNGVEVSDNTVAWCGHMGQMVHNSFNNIIQRNTYFDNHIQFYFQGNGNDYGCLSDTIVGNTIRHNILFSKTPDQSVMELTANGSNRVSRYGLFSGNYYCRPLNEERILRTASPDGDNYYNLQQWQAALGNDEDSHGSPVKIPAFTVNSLIGSNKFGNGAFNTNTEGVSPWIDTKLGSFSMTWDNTGGLDGGALKFVVSAIAPNNPEGLLVMPVGSLDSAKNYILRFSLRGSADTGVLTLHLRNGADYRPITADVAYPIRTSRSEAEFLLTPSRSVSGDIEMAIHEQDGVLWLDNITLQEADVSITDPDDHIRFEYNTTNTSKVVALDGNYIDAAGASYSGSITLQPFASAVLIKQSGGSGLERAINRNICLRIWPNPVSGRLLIESDQRIERVCIYSIQGKVVCSAKPFAFKAEPDIFHLAPGLYFLKTIINGKVQIEKFIKQ